MSLDKSIRMSMMFGPEDMYSDFGEFLDKSIDAKVILDADDYVTKFKVQLDRDSIDFELQIYGGMAYSIVTTVYDRSVGSANRPKGKSNPEQLETMNQRLSNLLDVVRDIESKGYKGFQYEPEDVGPIENGLITGYAVRINVSPDLMMRRVQLRKVIDDFLPRNNSAEVPFLDDSDGSYSDLKNYIQARVNPQELSVETKNIVKFIVGFGKEEQGYSFHIDISKNVMEVYLRADYARKPVAEPHAEEHNRSDLEHLEIITQRTNSFYQAVNHMKSKGYVGSFTHRHNARLTENGLNLDYCVRIELPEDPAMRNVQIRSIAMDIIPEKYHKNPQLKY